MDIVGSQQIIYHFAFFVTIKCEPLTKFFNKNSTFLLHSSIFKKLHVYIKQAFCKLKFQLIKFQLIPNLQKTVPATRSRRHPVLIYPNTTNPIIMPRQNPRTITFNRIPNTTIKIIIPSQKQPPRFRKRHRSNPNYYSFMAANGQFLVAS